MTRWSSCNGFSLGWGWEDVVALWLVITLFCVPCCFLTIMIFLCVHIMITTIDFRRLITRIGWRRRLRSY